MVITAYKNIEYFMTPKLLNRQKARWYEFLSQFNFKIPFILRNQGGKHDVQTKQFGHFPKKQDECLLY